MGTKETRGVRFFLESRKKQRNGIVDEKAAGIKLEGGTAAPPAPVAGENLNRPDESKLSSVRFLLSPFGRAAHALRRSKSACHGGVD